jgi:hypothetical protein
LSLIVTAVDLRHLDVDSRPHVVVALATTLALAIAARFAWFTRIETDFFSGFQTRGR